MSAFNGRLNRATYWLALGVIVLVLATLKIVGSKHAAVSEAALVILCVPRLHDIGKSGWYVIVGILIELAGIIIGFAFFPLAQAPAFVGAAVIVVTGLLIWLGAIPGDPRANHWGEPPAPGLSLNRLRRTPEKM